MKRTDKPKKEPAPSWYELVQPPAGTATADPARTYARREERGQIVPDTAVLLTRSGDGASRAYRRKTQGRGWNPGRLVQHRTRLSAVADDTPRASVVARRLRRAGRAA